MISNTPYGLDMRNLDNGTTTREVTRLNNKKDAKITSSIVILIWKI